MSAKCRALSDAPPTSAPSTSGRLVNSRALDGLTLSPYWIRTRRATDSSNSLTSNPRMNSCASCTLGRRGRLAGADRPHWFVGNNGVDSLVFAQAIQTPADLGLQDFFHSFRFTFSECFTDADNRLDRRGMRSLRFLGN